MDKPLLRTKLHIPTVLPGELVSRPRLLQQLDAGFQRKLIVISAPAGFGKTTLLCDWLLRRAETATGQVDPAQVNVAWFSIDETDNDLLRFLTYCVAALQTLDPAVGKSVRTLLQSSPPPPSEVVLTNLINDLAALPNDFGLVLDDYHLITNASIHEALSYWIDHLPAAMHLLITGRTDPPLPLPRLRVRRQMAEIRSADLRFTEAEAAAFLNELMGLSLSAEDIATLEARTEGWIASLQLAALSMQGLDGRAIPRFIADFTGSHHYIVDYLVEEVLSRQPESIRTFLLQTSILDRFCASLCDAVTGRADSRATLDHLRAANIFLIALDHERSWYRYHHLFAELLRSRLFEVSDAAELEALHQRASAWYEANELLPQAIDHAFTAHDLSRAAALIEQVAVSVLDKILWGPEISQMRDWLERLPEVLLLQRPNLIVAHAQTALLTMQGSEDMKVVERRVRDLGLLLAADQATGGPASAQSRQPGLYGAFYLMQGYLKLFAGEVTAAITLARQALQYLPAERSLWRMAAHSVVGAGHTILGDLAGADAAYGQVTEMAQKMEDADLILASMSAQADMHFERGQLRQAEIYYRQALQLAADFEGEAIRSAISPDLGLASLLREWNRLDEAESYIADALALAAGIGMKSVDLLAYLILAQVFQARGRYSDAHEALDRCAQMSQQVKIAFLATWIPAVQARFWLWQGNSAAAIRWAESSGLDPADVDQFARMPGEYTTLVRVYLIQGRVEAAHRLLKAMLPLMQEKGRMGRVIENFMLQALAYQAEGDQPQAFAALEKSLTLAESEHYTRIFLDEGLPMAHLLLRASNEKIASGYTARLLTAFSETGLLAGIDGQAQPTSEIQHLKSQINDILEPLSDRELDVLRLLPADLSSREIADTLVISVHTVRSHIKSIYSKLNVSSREEAVDRARALKLLPS